MKFILSIASAVFILISCSTSPNNNGGNNTVVIPLAPTNLSAVAVDTTQVNLTWTDNSTNEAGYKVQRKIAGGIFADVASTAADMSTFSDFALTSNTTYTYRVYAYNSAGNSLQYSNEVTITTNRSSANLPSVTICNQVWSTKNLDVTTYRNGDAIPQVTDSVQWANLTTGAWCYYNNDPAMGIIYGKLYNWYAVNDPRGLAPTGYHVPSDAEWTNLASCLGGFPYAGEAMKEAGFMHWLDPNSGLVNTNSSGFTALPGGIRDYNGSFGDIGYFGYWWSSTEDVTPFAKFRQLLYNSGSIYYGSIREATGFSVRCLRD